MDNQGDFVGLLIAAMSQKGMTVRGLEKAIRSEFGEAARVSRSLVSLYLRRKVTPTYEAGYQIAKTLDMDIKKTLKSLHNTRLNEMLADEEKRFKQFLRAVGESGEASR